MKKKYKYSIYVAINNAASTTVLYKGTSQYAGGGGRLDQISIKGGGISLECGRATLIDLEGVFKNYQSGLYGQISKCILFYISTMQAIPDIASISIKVEREGVFIKEKLISSKEFKGHAELQSQLKARFNSVSLQVIFDESDKSAALLKSISHLIRSKTKQDTFDRFDSLWKSYNALYKIIARKPKDHECHVELRKFILNNPSASKSIVKLTSKMTASELRAKLRWRALILNDFESLEKTKSFHDFIMRYTDARLMKVFEEILPYREAFLNTKGLLQNVKNHIKTHLNSGINNDQELVSILCIKYMYFVRNKSAHGERMDRIIGLGSKEAKEIKWLSDLLEILVIDLINDNKLYK